MNDNDMHLNDNLQAHDDDSIEFGTDVDTSDIVSFNKDDAANAAEAYDPYEDEDLQGPIVSHRKERTLMTNSPMLKLIEEVNGERPQKKQPPHALIISCIFFAIIALIVGGIAIFSVKDAKENAENAVKEEEEAPAKMAQRSEIDFKWRDYDVMPRSANALVNGVALKTMKINAEEDGMPLVADKKNMVSFYAENYVPYAEIIDPERDFEDSPLKFDLMDAQAYQTSNLTIKAPQNVVPGQGIIYVNGRPHSPEKDIHLKAISGFPYYIHIQHQGFGDHLHIVWPIRQDETVELPPMQAQSNAARVTILNLTVPKDYQNDKSFVLKINAEGSISTSPGMRRIAKHELIDISMIKDGRYPFNLILDSTPFGSITVESYMQLSSLGVANVRFDSKANKDVTLCFRRASEAVCLTDEEKPIPSGKWEIVAYRMVGDKKEWLEGAPYEKLSPNAEYTFTLKSTTKLEYTKKEKKRR